MSFCLARTTLAARRTGTRALRAISREGWDLVLPDYQMPGADGVRVIGALKHADPHGDCIMLTGWSSVDRPLRPELVDAFLALDWDQHDLAVGC